MIGMVNRITNSLITFSHGKSMASDYGSSDSPQPSFMCIFNKVFVLSHDNLMFYHFISFPVQLQCLPLLHPPPCRLSRPPSPSYKRPWRCLLCQCLTARVSGMLSGWIASFPLCPNVSYAGNRFIASLAWSKGLTCDTWYHFVGSTIPSLASLTWFPLTATTW